MTHSSDTLIAHPYDHTRVLAIALSRTSWGLAAQVSGLPRPKTKKTIAPKTHAREAAIDGHRA